MNQEIKQKWVEALRSGQYEQARGQLRTKDNKFCCLGVLCDVMDNTAWVNTSDEPGDIEYFWHDDNTVLGDETLAKAELAEDQSDILWLMNDSQKLSFAKIANYIEKNL